MKQCSIQVIKSFCLLALIFCINNINAQNTTETFSTPGTFSWTVPACVNSVTVEVWGGGGGGGAVWSRFDPPSNSPSSDEICTGAGGGGGGGYTRRTYTVVPGQTYTIVVGSGGIGGIVNNSLSTNRAQNGSPGGNSTFSGPATLGPGTLTAFGGNGGGAANILRSCLGGCSGAVHQGVNGPGGTGGSAANGTSTFTGGNGGGGNHSSSTEDRSGSGGGGAGSAGNGGNGTNAGSPPPGGTGGTGGGGNGGNGIQQPFGNGYLGTNGTPGNVIGGAGGGACGHNRAPNNNTHRSNTGGNGARGEVRLTYPNANAPTANLVNTNISCSGGTNGTINLTVSGGTSPYTFNWGSGITSEDRTGLSAGTYAVTISDAAGCTSTASTTITQPAAITATTASTNTSCNGVNNGTITVSAGGGTGSLSFNWGSGITSQNRSGLSAGTYTVTITDVNNCSTTRTVSITEPSALTSSIVSVTNGTCTVTAAIDISVSGGSGAYTYIWNDGATTQDRTGLSGGSYTVTISDANSCTISNGPISVSTVGGASVSVTSSSNISCNGLNDGAINITASGTGTINYNWGGGISSEDRTGLSAGTYVVTVTDANNCTASATITISEPTALTATNTSVNLSCNGSSNGSINITAGGGTGTLNFNWGGGITSEDRSGLSAGIYTVTISDQNGCSTTNTASISEATAITVTTASSNITCNGNANGSINLTASGGTGTFSYNWGGGITTEDRSGLSAGTYNVTISDANGCTVTRQISITEPAALTISATSVNVSCNGNSNGRIDITVSGGTSSYSYNWSNASSTQNLSGLNSGNYSLTVTDANGCTVASSAIAISEPAAIVLSGSSTASSSCNNNGAIALSVNGGTGPYAFLWSNGSTSEDLNSIAGGNYSVTVSDANGCTSSTALTVAGGSALNISLDANDEACGQAGTGSITTTVSGGTSPYTFIWSNGATSEDISALASGLYTLTVTDIEGCIAVDSALINSPFVPSLNALIMPSMSIDSTVVWGDETIITGGTDQSAQGVSYQWASNGPGSAAFSSDSTILTTVNPTVDGSYVIYISALSNEGCEVSDTVYLLVEANDPVIPTAFSPNNDGLNDLFEVVRLNKANLSSFKVYNRWGELLYDDATEGAWDGTYKGKEQPREVYIYIISWFNPGGNVVVKRGALTLMR
jgi:gliding motility-associated-like protein